MNVQTVPKAAKLATKIISFDRLGLPTVNFAIIVFVCKICRRSDGNHKVQLQFVAHLNIREEDACFYWFFQTYSRYWVRRKRVKDWKKTKLTAKRIICECFGYQGREAWHAHVRKLIRRNLVTSLHKSIRKLTLGTLDLWAHSKGKNIVQDANYSF